MSARRRPEWLDEVEEIDGLLSRTRNRTKTASAQNKKRPMRFRNNSSDDAHYLYERDYRTSPNDKDA